MRVLAYLYAHACVQTNVPTCVHRLVDIYIICVYMYIYIYIYILTISMIVMIDIFLYVYLFVCIYIYRERERWFNVECAAEGRSCAYEPALCQSE